jgi:hypothetical protein
VRRRIGTERKVVRFCRVAQRIKDHTGLNPGDTLNRIDFQDPIHVLGEVEHNRDVATLPGQAGAGASRQNWRAVPPANRNRRDDVLVVPRYDKPDWDLTVVRTIRRVQRSTATVESDLSSHLPPQLAFEFCGLWKGVDRFGVRTERQWNDHYPIGCADGTS